MLWYLVQYFRFISGANLHHAVVLIEGYPACDMDFTILRIFVDILLCSKEHGDASLFGQTAVALAKVLIPSTNFVTDGFLAQCNLS